jgi:hypothetical protein
LFSYFAAKALAFRNRIFGNLKPVRGKEQLVLICDVSHLIEWVPLRGKGFRSAGVTSNLAKRTKSKVHSFRHHFCEAGRIFIIHF